MSERKQTPAERRRKLLFWLRMVLLGQHFTTEEASVAVEAGTQRRLYEGDGAVKTCGRDLGQLRKEGEVEKIGDGWKIAGSQPAGPVATGSTGQPDRGQAPGMILPPGVEFPPSGGESR